MAQRPTCPRCNCAKCVGFEGSVFPVLSQKELEKIESAKTVNFYRRKQVVFYEGNPSLGLYCIHSGKVKIYKTSPEGKEQILKISGPGELIGHTSFFARELLNVTAEVIEDAGICFIDKSAFLALLAQNSALATSLVSRLAREIAQTEEKVMDVAYKSVRVRLAELLLALKTNFGVKSGKGYRLDVLLSREEMAQATGMTTETAIRVISEFKEDGIIQFDGRTMEILIPEKLEEMRSTAF